MDNTYFDRTDAEIRKTPFGIFINQAGYRPQDKKTAVMPFSCTAFDIINEKNDIVFSGTVSHHGMDEMSGDDVYIADFSDFKDNGKYRISADGKISAIFEISEDVNKPVLRDLMRAFYYLRCGEGLAEKHAGVYKHGECHMEKAVLWEDNNIALDVSGGWHDAGDYGRYVTAGVCALAHLLNAYMMFPKLEKLVLDIPESGNGVPDILNECRVELEWILKMQRPDGGVYHKATTKMHAPFIMPEDDKEQMYVFPVSSMAVADTAAICAMASRIYSFDKEFSEQLAKAAFLSYDWLEKNPGFIGFKNPEGCNTGGYGERDDISNRFWAAAEMYVLTGKEKYHDDMKRQLQEDFFLAGLGYGDVGGFGALSYLRFAENKDSQIAKKLADTFIYKSKELAEKSERCGYGAAMVENDYHWGSNMELLKYGMTFIIADYITGEKKFADYARKQADYLLGVNAMGISYVTGTGEYRCNYPHLRPAHADGIEECIPGMVSGGPNRFPGDPDAKILIPEGTPPMKCFADDVGCYSLNEITIYWNSPAVFLFGYLCE